MLNSNYIKQRREALGLTQQQAADAAAMTMWLAMAAIIAGKPGHDMRG